MGEARTLQVQVVSRSGGEFFSGRATHAVVPLSDGALGVYPRREPLLALLGQGDVRVTPCDENGTPQGSETVIPVVGGFCSVDHDVLTVAADAAGDELDTAQVVTLTQRDEDSDLIADVLTVNPPQAR